MGRALVALVLAVAALPAAAGSGRRQKVAVLDVKSVQGVAPGTATILTSIIAGDTARAGFDVLSQSDIAALIGFERQKQMLGCGDDSSCLAEIGGALGAEYVLYTQVGEIGSRIHISLQLLDARKGVVVGRVSTFSKSNEDALTETAESAVAEVIAAARAQVAVAVAQGSSKSPAAASAPSSREPSGPDAGRAAAPSSSPATTSSAAEAGALATAGSWWSGRRPYVEARVVSEWTNVPMRDSDGSKVSGAAVGLTAKGGIRWTAAWTLEIGLGFQNFETHDFTVRRTYPLSGDKVFGARAEAGKVFASVGTAWAPRANPYFSIAADVGVAALHCSYLEWTLPNVLYDYGPASGRDASSWAPRLGAELRLDYPISWATFGVRLGFAAVHNGAIGKGIWYDGLVESSFDWLEPGWFVSIPTASASVRYRF